jgi:hypothetical protein
LFLVFYRNFICFQFHSSISICYILFSFSLVLILFIFLAFSWIKFSIQFHPSIGWLAPYFSGHKFVILTQIDSSNFFILFFLFNFVLLYWMDWKLSYIVCPTYKNIFFIGYCYHFFLIWSTYCHYIYCLSTNLKKPTYLTRSSLWFESYIFF